jgi:hypothetical protein
MYQNLCRPHMAPFLVKRNVNKYKNAVLNHSYIKLVVLYTALLE